MPYRIILCFLIIAWASLFSCRKKPVDENKDEPSFTEIWGKGLLILNEGLFQQNNSTLGFQNSSKNYQPNYFQSIAGRPLGDTGNDMQAYGGKIYMVVNVSSTIEVLDRQTGKWIKQINMLSNGTSKQPRYIAFNGSNAFVSCYDGYVDRIDTGTLEVVQRIKVGNNPEQLAVSNNRLFVANSGGLNFPDLDSTVSVIDLDTKTEITKVLVGQNPGSVKVTSNGDIFVHSRGDFASIPSKLMKIDPLTLVPTTEYPEKVVFVEAYGTKLLLAIESAGTTHLNIWNVDSHIFDQTDFIDLQNLQTFYGIQFDVVKNKIYLFDARAYVNTGRVIQYTANGALLQSIETGLIPTKVYEN